MNRYFLYGTALLGALEASGSLAPYHPPLPAFFATSPLWGSIALDKNESFQKPQGESSFVDEMSLRFSTPSNMLTQQDVVKEKRNVPSKKLSVLQKIIDAYQHKDKNPVIAFNRLEQFGLAKITPGRASGDDASLARTVRAYLAPYQRIDPTRDFGKLSDEEALLTYLIVDARGAALNTETISFQSFAPIAFMKDIFTQAGVFPMEISQRYVKSPAKVLSSIDYELWGTSQGKNLSEEKRIELHGYVLNLFKERADLYKILEKKCKSAQELNRAVNSLLARAFWNCSLSLKTLLDFYIFQMTQETSDRGTQDMAKLMVQKAAPTYPFFTYVLLNHLDLILDWRSRHQQRTLQMRREETEEEIKFLRQNGVNIKESLAIPTTVSSASVPPRETNQKSLLNLTWGTRAAYETAFAALQQSIQGLLPSAQLPGTVVLCSDGAWAYVLNVTGNDLSPTLKTNACFNTTGLETAQTGAKALSGASVEKLIRLKHDASLTDQWISLLIGAPSFILRQISRHMQINREFVSKETAQALVQEVGSFAILQGERLYRVPQPLQPICPVYLFQNVRMQKGKKISKDKEKLFKQCMQRSRALTKEGIDHLVSETGLPAWFWSSYQTSGDDLYLRMTFSPKALVGLMMERLLNKNAQKETRQTVGLITAVFQLAYPRTITALLQRARDQLILDETRQKLRESFKASPTLTNEQL